MKFFIWGLLLIGLALADYKLLFNPLCVELVDREDRLIARSFREGAFHAYGRFPTAGCTPAKMDPQTNRTVFECFADLQPEDERQTVRFVITPDVPWGSLPDVETVAFHLEHSK